MWSKLIAFARVRSEWRTDPLAWLLTDVVDTTWILHEAAGTRRLWGTRSTRLSA
jgi:hypothetical protein